MSIDIEAALDFIFDDSKKSQKTIEKEKKRQKARAPKVTVRSARVKSKRALSVSSLNAVELYKDRLSGKLAKFPRGLLAGEYGNQNLKLILTYLFRDLLSMDDVAILKADLVDLFIEYKLIGLFNRKFNASPMKLFKFLEVDTTNYFLYRAVEDNYWDDASNMYTALDYMVSKLGLKLTSRNILATLGSRPLKKYTLPELNTLYATYHEVPQNPAN